MTTESAWFVGLLCDVSLKALLLAAIAAAGLWLFRVRSTSVQHRVWLAVLVAMLLLPLLVAATPAVPLPAWAYPDWQVVSALEAAMPLAATTPEAIEQQDGGAEQVEVVATEPAQVSASERIEVDGQQPVAAAAPAGIEETPVARSWGELACFSIAVIYVLGLWLFASRLAYGMLLARRLVRSAKVVDLGNAHVRMLGGTRVLESSGVRVPLTVGWWRPAILLPFDWREWSDSMLAAVLAHELAHVRRGDTWAALAAQANRALYWFHPLGWFLNRRLMTLAEAACDDAVIETLGDRANYARHLLEVASRLGGRRSRLQPVGVAMAARPRVEQRIEAILDDGRPLTKRLTKRATFALLAIAVPLVALTAALQADEGSSQVVPGAESTSAQPLVEEPAAEAKPEATDGDGVLSGRIVDESGEPVTDATVELTSVRARGDDRLRHYETKTDAEGRYRFEKVEGAGEYSIRVTSTQWIGITDWRTLPRVVLTPTSQIRKDFTLPLGCQIGVVVVDEAGNPIEDAQLYAGSLADEMPGNRSEAQTSKFGLANIGGLKPSDVDYIVGVYHEDYGYAKEIVELREPGAVALKRIVMSPGVDVSGTAICSDDKPATGWKVYALPSWWRFGVSHRGAEIGEDGKFTLMHVLPDNYDLNVHIPSGGGVSRTEVAATKLKLPPESGQVDLRLRTMSPQSMTAIAGKIRYEGKEPPNGFWIFANSMEGQQHVSTHVEAGATEFRIAPVPPGRYRVTIENTEIEPVTLTDVEAPADDLELKVRAIEPPGLRGTVVRKDGGQPVSKFRVRIEKLGTLRGPNYTQEPSWYEFDDADGEFEAQVAGPGIYRVLVAAEGYAWTRSADVNSDKDESRDIRVELVPGAKLVGTVVNEQGEPIDGATVLPLSKASGSMGRTLAEFATKDGEVKTVDGSFTLADLSPGKETLKVMHPDYCFTIVSDVDVPAEGGVVAPITLTRGGSIQGHVYDDEGQPEANVTLYVQNDYAYSGGGDDEAGRYAAVVTDAEGFYEVHGLPEEICHVQRQEQWTASGVVRLAVLPKNGETRTVDFGGKTPVSGRLLVNGEPLGGTRVQLGGENPNFGVFKAFAQTDGDGAFTFWSPPVGTWTLYYLLPGRRSDWCRVTEIDVADDKLDLGTIERKSSRLMVRVAGDTESGANQYRLMLQEYNPVWPHGTDVGAVSPAGAVGEFVIENVPAGSYELVCWRQDGLVMRQLIEVEAGAAPKQVTLEWPPGKASIEGEFRAADGGPGHLTPISLWSKDRRLQRSVMGGEDNRYRIENLPAGDYYFTEKHTRDAAPAVEFSLNDGETKKLDLTRDVYRPQPTTDGTLRLMILTDRGTILSGCDVELTGPGGKLEPLSAQMGQLTFLGAPGTYRMTARYPGFQTVVRNVELKRSEPGARSSFDAATKVVLQASTGATTE